MTTHYRHYHNLKLWISNDDVSSNEELYDFDFATDSRHGDKIGYLRQEFFCPHEEESKQKIERIYQFIFAI